MTAEALRSEVGRRAITVAGLISILWPTSLGGVIQPNLVTLLCFSAGTALGLALLWSRWISINVPLGLCVVALFLLFTLTSPFSDITPGGLLPYLVLMAGLTIDIRSLSRGYEPVVALLVLNAALLTLGFGTIAGSEIVIQLLELYYQAFYEDLFLFTVVAFSKPVTVFASHSIASLAYLALICLNLRIARCSPPGNPIRLACTASSAGYLVLIPFLASNTAVAAFPVAYFIFGWHVFRKLGAANRMLAMLLTTIALLYALAVIAQIRLGEVIDLVLTMITSESGGFLSRYAYGGALQPTYDYLIANLFRPIGLTNSAQIVLVGDTFITEYIIKISIVGYALLLSMLWIWLRRNLPEGRAAVGMMMFLLVADLGYPLLPYPRAAGFLPLFVLLWIQSVPDSTGWFGNMRTPARSGRFSGDPVATTG